MSRVPICDAIAAHVLDDLAERPPGAEAHLETCAECRALLASHRAALQLAGEAVAAAVPVTMATVRARARRRATLGAAAAAAAAAASVLLVLGIPGPDGPRPTAGADLFALAEEVRGYEQRDLAREDPVLGAYGPVARWFAPPPRHPLDLPSIPPLDRGESPGGSP